MEKKARGEGLQRVAELGEGLKEVEEELRPRSLEE